ncbi:MAG: oxidase, partial [Planctomycetota bacterium]
HLPCHRRVLDPKQSGLQLLRLVPELEVDSVDSGCTGMAGTWGLQRKNYRNSLRIGWPMLTAMRSGKSEFATTQCSACKMQIEHGARRKTIHPVKLLAHAYGGLPQLADEMMLN